LQRYGSEFRVVGTDGAGSSGDRRSNAERFDQWLSRFNSSSHDAGQPGSAAPGDSTSAPTSKAVEIVFAAMRADLFKTFPALPHLADKADGGKISVRVSGTSATRFDPTWFRNAVDEPLDEADIERQVAK